MPAIPKRIPYRNKEILDSANGEPCTVCGIEDGSTVFCHFNYSWAGKGMGQKADDCAGFYGCHQCHDAYDSIGLDPTDLLRAYYKTIRRLIDEGILK